jgi:cysteinyl-tRNA synthetase
MAMRYLGESFDIHGGGEDLIFPHHECEIAQSEAATGKPFVRVWVHNGFVNLGAEKMSKSLGNILTVRELVKRHDPQALRLWLLGTHYRSPVEWSQERVGEAARALRRLRGLVQEADRAGYTYADLLELREDGTLGTTAAAFSDDAIVRGWSGVETAFQDAMDDDFNTPAALAALFDLSRELNKYRDTPGSHQRRFAYGVAILVRLAAVLGLESFPIAEMRGPEGELRRQIEARVAQREQARKRRDWAEADKLRDELRELGVTVEDTPSGPHWVWKPPEP